MNGLRSGARPADALWFGTGVHIALAEWYGMGFDRGRHPAKTFAEWCGDEVRSIKASLTERDREWFDEPLYIDAQELGVAMLREYVRHYGDDPNLEVLAIEQAFEVDLEYEGETIVTFAGTFDGVALDHDDGLIYLLEHKTAASIKTAHLSLDDQAGGYFAAADTVLHAQGILGPKEHVAGVMYNFLRKSVPDDRPKNKAGASLNKDGSVSKKQPAIAFHREWVDRGPREVATQFRRIVSEVRWMNAIRDGELPVTKSITDMCPYCQFFVMCGLHEKGGQAWKEYRDIQYKTYDPYADHRKSAAE
jgi:hypothetical protein